MKSKAKPVKGSARTKRFDVGGTVGALAGLGTLAYLLNKKKKGADAEYKPQGKFPEERAQETAKPEPYKAVGNEGKEDVFKGGMEYKKPEASATVEKKTPRAKGYNPPAEKKTSTSTRKQGAITTTGVDAGIAAGNKKRESAAPSVPSLKPGESRSVGNGAYKPYPSDAQRAKTKEDARLKDLSKRGFVTPGKDKDRKDTTKGRSANPIQGTIDNAGKSMARTREQQIQDNIRAVAKRKEDEKAQKLGYGIKKGGMVKKYASGGSVSASRRADGIAQRGKTRGKVY